MYAYTAKQRNLLKALRQVSDEVWALRERLHLEAWEKDRLIRLERVRTALVLDAKQEKDSFEGVMRLAWTSDVLAASVPTPLPAQRSTLEESIGRDYPSNLEADSKPTSSSEG